MNWLKLFPDEMKQSWKATPWKQTTKKDQKTDERGLCDKKERRDWKPEEKKKDAVLSSLEKKRNQDNKRQQKLKMQKMEHFATAERCYGLLYKKKSDALRAHTRRTESKSAWRRE